LMQNYSTFFGNKQKNLVSLSLKNELINKHIL
jgi:16S rRNA G527 N7-methylase RsmG